MRKKLLSSATTDFLNAEDHERERIVEDLLTKGNDSRVIYLFRKLIQAGKKEEARRVERLYQAHYLASNVVWIIN